MDEEKRKTLMAALDNLSVQRENLSDLSRRSDTMREKMYRTEDQNPTTAFSGESGSSKEPPPLDIVDLFNNVARDMQVLIENVRQNINSTIDLID